MIVQLAPAANVVVQVPPERVNTPAGVVGAKVALMPVSAGAPTGLLSVMVCAALTVPCATLPKFRASGATVGSRVLVPWNSTAPTSIPDPEGRALPKKSVGGASEPARPAVGM